MNEYLQLCLNIFERSIIFGFSVASVYLSSALIGFDNLAIEGSFGLGGALTAVCINAGLPPFFATLLAIIFGALSGIATGVLNRILKLNPLVSGIVITTALFSISLVVAGSTIALRTQTTILSFLQNQLGQFHTAVILSIICFLLFKLTQWFLNTEIGFLLKAVGCTPQMLINLGKNPDVYYILGITLSNVFAALAGSLFVQYTGYFSIWASIGILIIGLTGMILAQTISNAFGFVLVIGSLLYQIIISLTFEFNINPDLNKLITALLIIGLIISKQTFAQKENHAKS